MIELCELDGLLFIYRFTTLHQVPLAALQALEGTSFWNLSVSKDEVSLVAPEFVVAKEVPAEGPWIAFRVLGTLDFELTGIMASLTAPLAETAVSVFAISTYDTDYLLVKADARERAVNAWAKSGVPLSSG